jgi:hypothetical protein
MKVDWPICIIVISILFCNPIACSDCPNIWTGTWTMREFVSPEDATYFNDTTMILRQEECRVTGTFSNGGLIDGNSSRWSWFLDPVTMDFPCNLFGNYSVPVDWNQRLPATNEGKRIYGKFVFTLPKSHVNNLSGEFSGPGIAGRLIYGGRNGGTETAPYELSVSPHSEKAQHPLAIVISLKENEKPVPNAKLKVHAFNLPGNDEKLADYFTVSSCTNCFWGSKGDKKIALICEGYKPIGPESGGPLLGPTSNPGSSGSFEPNCPLKQTPLEVVTDGNGMAKLEFFLDLAQLGDQAPRKGQPLSIPVKVEYWEKDGAKKIAEKDIDLNLDYVGVVEGITYEAPPELDRLTGDTVIDSITGKPKEQKTGDLVDYSGDPGTSAGLKKSDRVRISEEAKLLPEGVPTGRPLKVKDKLYVEDKILINAENLKVTRGNMVMSGGLWVRMRFFDGFAGKVGVSGNVPSHVVVIGPTPEKTGFTSWASSFIHWGSMIGSEIDSRANPKSYMIKEGMKQIAPELVPYLSAYSKAKKIKEVVELIYEMKPVYISVESAIAVDYDDQGQMLVTTREGNATIYTEATGEEGFAVPAGKTAVIPSDLMPILNDTDVKTARDADDLLADLEDPFASSPVFAGSGSSALGGASEGASSTNGTAPGSDGAGMPGAGNATGENATASSGGGVTTASGSSTPGVSGAGTSTTTTSPSNNNQIGDASEIKLDQPVGQAINPAGSSNFYRFHAETSGNLELKLEIIPKDMRPEIHLRDKNFGEIAYKSASNPGDSLRLEKDILGPGWFYIEVRDQDGKAHSESYALKTSFQPAPDRHEPNPNFFRSAEVKSAQTVDAYICPGGDEDYYRIYAETSGIIELKLEAVPKDMKSEISIRDMSSSQTAYASASNAGDKVRLEKDVQGPGWFYIMVRDLNGKAYSEPYSLKVSFKPAADQYEHNPNLFRATEIALGQSINAYICPGGDEDYYKLRVDGQQILNIRLENVPADMKSEISIRDKSSSQIAYASASNPGDKVRLEKDVQGPGWFYIMVRDLNGKAYSEPYTITFNAGASA